MSTATEKKNDTKARIKELQSQVDDLKELVNTLLSVIVEEPDGVHSGCSDRRTSASQHLHVIIHHGHWLKT